MFLITGEYLMKKKLGVGTIIVMLVISTTILINNHRKQEQIQLKQQSKLINKKKWSKTDYEDLLAGDNISADKPYTSNQISMYLKIVHDHGKPVSRKAIKKGDVVETTAIWKNIKNHPKETITLVFQGIHDESLILTHKESSIWAH